jgi:hypothetical protein
VDPFALIMLAIVGGLLVAFLALGRFYPGSGAQQLDWRPTRSVDVDVQNEIDDEAQMREAINARRRARGQAELTPEDVRARVAEDVAVRRRLRDGSGGGSRDPDGGA